MGITEPDHRPAVSGRQTARAGPAGRSDRRTSLLGLSGKAVNRCERCGRRNGPGTCTERTLQAHIGEALTNAERSFETYQTKYRQGLVSFLDLLTDSDTNLRSASTENRTDLRALNQPYNSGTGIRAGSGIMKKTLKKQLVVTGVATAVCTGCLCHQHQLYSGDSFCAAASRYQNLSAGHHRSTSQPVTSLP